MHTIHNTIQPLPESVVQLVKANIQITDLKSAIYELVCNAIEAGSRSVHVAVSTKDWTATVTDDGHGITAASMQLLGQRFCTSKPNPARGEVLHCLAQVSSLAITSRSQGAFETYRKTLGPNSIGGVKLCTLPRQRHGTTVSLTNFLQNQPVRRRQSKGYAAALEELKMALYALLLPHPAVELIVKQEGSNSTVLHMRKDRTLGASCQQLFPQMEDCLCTISTPHKQGWQLDGCVAVAPATFASTGQQLIYLNKRPVSCSVLQQQLLDWYIKSLRVYQADRENHASRSGNTRAPEPGYVLLISCPASVIVINGRSEGKLNVDLSSSMSQLNGVLQEGIGAAWGLMPSAWRAAAAAKQVADGQPANSNIRRRVSSQYNGVAGQQKQLDPKLGQVLPGHGLQLSSSTRTLAGSIAGTKPAKRDQPVETNITKHSSHEKRRRHSQDKHQQQEQIQSQEIAGLPHDDSWDGFIQRGKRHNSYTAYATGLADKGIAAGDDQEGHWVAGRFHAVQLASATADGIQEHFNPFQHASTVAAAHHEGVAAALADNDMLQLGTSWLHTAAAAAEHVGGNISVHTAAAVVIAAAAAAGSGKQSALPSDQSPSDWYGKPDPFHARMVHAALPLLSFETEAEELSSPAPQEADCWQQPKHHQQYASAGNPLQLDLDNAHSFSHAPDHGPLHSQQMPKHPHDSLPECNSPAVHSHVTVAYVAAMSSPPVTARCHTWDYDMENQQHTHKQAGMQTKTGMSLGDDQYQFSSPSFTTEELQPMHRLHCISPSHSPFTSSPLHSYPRECSHDARRLQPQFSTAASPWRLTPGHSEHLQTLGQDRHDLQLEYDHQQQPGHYDLQDTPQQYRYVQQQHVDEAGLWMRPDYREQQLENHVQGQQLLEEEQHPRHNTWPRSKHTLLHGNDLQLAIRGTAGRDSMLGMQQLNTHLLNQQWMEHRQPDQQQQHVMQQWSVELLDNCTNEQEEDLLLDYSKVPMRAELQGQWQLEQSPSSRGLTLVCRSPQNTSTAGLRYPGHQLQRPCTRLDVLDIQLHAAPSMDGVLQESSLLQHESPGYNTFQLASGIRHLECSLEQNMGVDDDSHPFFLAPQQQLNGPLHDVPSASFAVAAESVGSGLLPEQHGTRVQQLQHDACNRLEWLETHVQVGQQQNRQLNLRSQVGPANSDETVQQQHGIEVSQPAPAANGGKQAAAVAAKSRSQQHRTLCPSEQHQLEQQGTEHHQYQQNPATPTAAKLPVPSLQPFHQRLLRSASPQPRKRRRFAVSDYLVGVQKTAGRTEVIQRPHAAGAAKGASGWPENAAAAAAAVCQKAASGGSGCLYQRGSGGRQVMPPKQKASVQKVQQSARAGRIEVAGQPQQHNNQQKPPNQVVKKPLQSAAAKTVKPALRDIINMPSKPAEGHKVAGKAAAGTGSSNPPSAAWKLAQQQWLEQQQSKAPPSTKKGAACKPQQQSGKQLLQSKLPFTPAATPNVAAKPSSLTLEAVSGVQENRSTSLSTATAVVEVAPAGLSLAAASPFKVAAAGSAEPADISAAAAAAVTPPKLRSSLSRPKPDKQNTVNTPAHVRKRVRFTGIPLSQNSLMADEGQQNPSTGDQQVGQQQASSAAVQPDKVSGYAPSPANVFLELSPAAVQRAALGLSRSPYFQQQEVQIAPAAYGNDFKVISRAAAPNAPAGGLSTVLSNSSGELSVILSVDELSRGSSFQLVPGSVTRQQLQQACTLTQVDNKMVVVRCGSKLLAIDQHAADERIQLEALQQQLAVQQHSVQQETHETLAPKAVLLQQKQLTPGVSMLLSTAEVQSLTQYRPQVEAWGWKVALQNDSVPEKGAGHVSGIATPAILQQVPILCGVQLGALDLQVYLHQLNETAGSTAQVPPGVLRTLKSKACRTAIMFGTQLSQQQCVKLVQHLGATQLCFCCAHGRPTTAPLVDMTAVAERMLQQATAKGLGELASNMVDNSDRQLNSNMQTLVRRLTKLTGVQ